MEGDGRPQLVKVWGLWFLDYLDIFFRCESDGDESGFRMQLVDGLWHCRCKIFLLYSLHSLKLTFNCWRNIAVEKWGHQVGLFSWAMLGRVTLSSYIYIYIYIYILYIYIYREREREIVGYHYLNLHQFPRLFPSLPLSSIAALFHAVLCEECQTCFRSGSIAGRPVTMK